MMKMMAVSIMAMAVLAACGGQQSSGTAASSSGSGASTTASADGKDIIIGFSAPLTGPQSHYGEDYKEGVQMAIEEANAQNLTINGAPAKFVLMAEDDAADPKQATQVAERFVDKGVSGVIGHFNSGTTIPASKIYEENNIPNVSMATSPVLTQQGFKTVFRSMTSDSQQGLVLGTYAVKKLGYKTVGIIDDRTAYGQGLADEFEKSAKAAGATILPRQYTNDKATEFQSVLTTFKDNAPDVIFYGGADPQAAPMVVQMKRLGIKSQFLSGEMTKNPNFIKVAGENAEGVMASLAGVPLKDLPKGPEFETKYKAKYNKDVQIYSPYGYDGTWAMINAMKEANSSKPADYLPKLAATNMAGITSNNFAYDDKGDLKDVAITVYKVEKGQWVPVESLTAGNM
ncbi:branched-chain amino acid ABC transporter substrate-binding protein [Vitreoscilla stercoraria]|uniref:Branched-chain amino acid ABC transporter substrate-binding protein n=2 Tax=Neisseriaceae TaxID=481 RepID=A0ABY4EIU8_VITST|nr:MULTISPECIES: branched-chain amino acid ABC transporter substrate-binding protein [Vitreoscilla]AUZ05394.1 leucine/isoleucine/valine-binding protein [Vitreoscilla sp. C1]UOO93297.1 branched-chain amino acid ABC transporter substrate-binding protein [Vitreoscilla stercoraria]